MNNKLFIARIPQQTTAAELKQIFSQAGNVINCYIPPGTSFGFVTMETEGGASEAIKAFDGLMLHGSSIAVMAAKPK